LTGNHMVSCQGSRALILLSHSDLIKLLYDHPNRQNYKSCLSVCLFLNHNSKTNKKFELMLRRRANAYSSSCSVV